MENKKFNINNYFNTKLFFEAFKQTRIVSLIFFICLSVYAIFCPIILKSDVYIEELGDIPQETLLDIFTCMFPLLGLIFIAVPVMYIILFSFQTKRNASDFYHSLPVKRSCHFISYVAAIFSWACIITFTYTLITIISANITWSYFIIDYAVILSYAINVLICCALIIGVFSIGTALTGTLTSNVISSFGLLVIPRVIIFVFWELLISESLTLTDNSARFIFNNKCNILFAQLIDTFAYEGERSVFGILGGYSLYTAILALIYTGVGLILFVTRPSEIATKNFRNKKIFMFLKYGSGFIISLILVADVYENYKMLHEHTLEYLLIVIAVGLIMFALEASFSRSIKSGLKSILATPFILLLDVALIFGLTAITNHYDNERIDPNNVDYVYVEYDYYYYFSRVSNMDIDDFYGVDSLSSSLWETKITNPEILDYLLDIYNSDRAKRAEAMPYHGFIEIEVTFDSAIGEKTRCLHLTTVEFTTLGKMLLEDKNIQKTMGTYPEGDSIALNVYNSLDPEQTRRLYKTLLNELNEFNNESLYLELLKVSSGYSDVDVAAYVSAEYYKDGVLCYTEIPITPLTPKSYAMFINAANKAASDGINNVLNKTDNKDDKTNLYVCVNIYKISAEGTSYDHQTYYAEKMVNKFGDDLRIIKETIRNFNSSRIVFDEKNIMSGEYYIACISLYYYGEENYHNVAEMGGSYYVLLPKNSPLVSELDWDNMLDEEEFDENLDGGYDIEVAPEYEFDSEFQVN